ncbi:DUF5819 family protein [Streptomyces monashensis]|uniref:DUF5819 family protein n=1 Tax=Streptomyces monashensis TaxID=1678012 RepID=UPI003F54261A
MGPDDAGRSDSGRSDSGRSDSGRGGSARGASARAAGPSWANESGRADGSGPSSGSGRADQKGPVTGPGAEAEETGAGPAAGAGAAAVPPAGPRTGVAALSPRYQIAAALALAAVAVAAGVHVLMVFLSLAPANTVTKQHGKAVEEWVYPEFEQNWKLFAPNPLQQNIAVQVRAEVRTKGGELRTTGWTDLSAEDGAAIDGNLAPSHTEQNELRRAWDFFTATHGTDNRPVGMRGSLSEEYLRRIVVMRLYRNEPPDRLGVIQQVQIRSRTTNVQPPKWSPERVSDQPVYRLLPWWTVTADEAAGGVR